MTLDPPGRAQNRIISARRATKLKRTIREQGTPARLHQEFVGNLYVQVRAALEGAPEVWLVPPTDRTVTIYRLVGAAYGRATVRELTGELAVTALPAIRIDWGRVNA